MTGGRAYPDEPAGPFEAPPVDFEDAARRAIAIRGHDPGAPVPGALVAMYEAFDPADRAQGIPPSGEARIESWLAELFGSGFNVVASHGAAAVGHATLVPAPAETGPPAAGDAGAGAWDGAGDVGAEGGSGDGDPGADTGHGAGDADLGSQGDAGPGAGRHAEAASGDRGATEAGTAGGGAVEEGGTEGGAVDVGGEGDAVEPGDHPPYELAIFVLQDYQRAGIGTRLLRALLGLGAARGVERVWLTVERWNHPAIELYGSVGFEAVGEGTFEREMSIRLAPR